MIIELDLTDGPSPARLAHPAHFGAFHLRVVVAGGKPDWQALERALHGLARIEDESAFFAVEAIERLAGDRAGSDEWRAGFAAMLDYATAKGWRDESGAVAAHVEWEAEVLIESDEFRHVLGHFPTGVAVITADRPGDPVGMACNSLTSVSLKPPLIAVCPAKTSTTWPEIRDAGRFLVNLMHSDHAETVRDFARQGADRFAAVRFHERRCGPALDDALAWIECAIVAEHDAGDHTVVLARVMGLEARDDLEPLVFFRGSYGTFAPRTTA
jgi:flavin reductase (DIM6/NTAB) family NADH-FMN oxidoreductase RutF